MNEEIVSLDTLLNLIKNKKLKIVFIIIVLLIITIFLYKQQNNYYIISFALLLLFLLFLLIDCIMKNKLKRCPDYMDGICIRTNADDYLSQRKINFSLITNIKDRIKFEKYNIKFIELPFDQVKLSEDMKPNDILEKTNCKVLIDIKHYCSGNQFKTKFNIYGTGINITKVNLSLNKFLIKDNSICYTSENMIETIENLSEFIAITSEYVYSYFCCKNKEYEKAISLLEDLIVDIKKYKLDKFEKHICEIIKVLSYAFAWLNYIDYTNTRIKMYIDTAEKYLIKSTEISSNNFQNILLNIRIRFLKYRDYQYALDAYKNIAFKKYDEIDSLFNLGFLYSYLNRNEMKILYTYIRAFRLFSEAKQFDKNEYIDSIFTFIFDFMTQEEIDNTNLNLAISILYLELTNLNKFKYYLNKYLKLKNVRNINPQGAMLLENRYNIKIKDYIDN